MKKIKIVSRNLSAREDCFRVYLLGKHLNYQKQFLSLDKVNRLYVEYMYLIV